MASTLRALACFALLSACSGGSTTGSDGGHASDAGTDAAMQPMDAAPPIDASTADASTADAGTADAGSADAGTDAGSADGGCDDPPPAATRPVAITCSVCRPTFPDPGPGRGGECTTHADCTAGTNGRCVSVMVGTRCDYDECFADDDCNRDQLCSCDGSLSGGNRCVPSNCRTNADCAPGDCSPTYGCLLGAPPEGWYCKTSMDECASDGDCVMPGTGGGRCAYDASRTLWACEYGICVF